VIGRVGLIGQTIFKIKTMKNLKFSFLLISTLAILFVAEVQAQEFYKLQTNNSKLVVTGTSTIHDWEMEATDFYAETLLKIEGNTVSEISQIEFNSPVEGLQSGKRVMDSKAHDALKEKKFPEVKFVLNKNGEVNFSGNNGKVTGLLTIAGKTKEVQLNVDLDVLSAQQFKVSGQAPVKMSDFGIDPPTAVMGTIKTGDDVVVKFDFEFNRSSAEYTRSN
jgi:polyisoprenoid-binding protein YceI